jgi:pyruvate dehydrogenase E2 component (dihydrolipoamide acetyltransferase)
MALPVIMPKQGQSVESCILTKWFKKKGDAVSKGDLLFSYETDKASFEAEAETDGTLLEVFFNEGDEIPVLVNIAVIGQPGEPTDPFIPGKHGVSSNAEPLPLQFEKQKAPTQEQSESYAETGLMTDGPVRISPRARQLATEKRIPFQHIKGSGPEGRIIEKDIHDYLLQHPRMTPVAQAVASEKGLAPGISGTGLAGNFTDKDLVKSGTGSSDSFVDRPLTNIRKIIAGAMHASLQQSAQLTHHMGANVSRLQKVRKHVKALREKGYPFDITLNDMICYAVIKALQKHPDVNAHYLGDRIRTYSSVHLGLAVDTDRGLMVPTLRNASIFSLQELSESLKTISGQCRNGNINPDLLSPASASFTVSNLGNYGVEMFTPVINLPQVAILGVNTILYRPSALDDGTFVFAPYIGLSLTYDHRAIDGGPATRFLAEIRNEIENFDETLIHE